MSDQSLKSRTAKTIKWNVIDRVASQILYAVTGIVLARLLSPADFGLVGAALVFQAFASLLVDSGFSYALIQRKNPTQTDYSTVLWFNIGIACVLYIILFFAAPYIAACFQNDLRIIPISRVIFLSFILNAAAIVQTNRLMKKMDVKMVAVSNSLGLLSAAVVGIALAVTGFGAWAIVWQTITLSAVKTLILWTTQRWYPSAVFSIKSLRSFFGIGSRMMLTSFLNTIFLNLYSFVIGNRVGMSALGYYTQSDKWSKMGIMSLSQVLTSSFLPALSAIQDDAERFERVSYKMNRFTAYIAFPAFIGLAVMATPIFHLLFDYKWDPSIILFQLLLIRGIFTVLIGYYNNVLLALGHAKSIMWVEIVRDGVALIALVATIPVIAESKPCNPVFGLEILLWGQLAASVIAWLATLIAMNRVIRFNVWIFVRDLLPYTVQCIIGGALMIAVGRLLSAPAIAIIVETAVGALFYIGVNHIAGSKIQKEVISYVTKSLRSRK